MKKNTIIILFNLILINFGYSQNPINVIITGICADASGTYTYEGVINGKNNYTKTSIVDGISITTGVAFDNVKWVLYAQGELSDDGFSNNNTINNLLPPNTGWVNSGCSDGTMIIQQLLSNEEFSINSSFISISPNPVQNILNIATKETIKEIYVYDLLGKKVAVNQISPSSIDVSNFANGIYLINVIGENEKTFSTKFIKE